MLNIEVGNLVVNLYLLKGIINLLVVVVIGVWILVKE